MAQQIQLIAKILGFVAYSVIVALTIQVLIWAADRKPPFEVITSQVTPPSYPGGQLLIEGEVKRDLSRECSFVGEHWIEDAKGFRHYLQPVAMGVDAIKRTDQVSPDYAKYAVPIPEAVPVGKSIYHVTQRYACNPIHLRAWPIEVETRIPFTLEARP